MINRTQEQITADWNEKNTDNPAVSIKCITYNHEKYIADALDGFLMQKTNFPFEIIVHDDASTDKTADIIREYEAKFPMIVKPIYEAENQYSKHDGSIARIVNAQIKGKYVAYCEGDDFWTDENKLQMQFDAMEAHPECTICFNRVKMVSEDKTEGYAYIPRNKCVFKEGIVTLKDFVTEQFKLGRWGFHTSSFLLKKETSVSQIDFKKNILPSFPYNDVPTVLYALTEGNGYFIDKTMSCYRVAPNGYMCTHSYNADMLKAYKAISKNATIEEQRKNDVSRKKVQERVIKGLEEFDIYTNYKYHKNLVSYMRRKEYEIILDKKSFAPKYWRFIIPTFFKDILRKISPKLFVRIKKIYHHVK